MTKPTPVSPSGPRDEVFSLFAFRLGPDLCLVPAREVVAVVATTTPAPLPRVPPHVLGLVNHDHRALAVFDLARFLDRPAPQDPVATAARTLVLHAGAYVVGVPVTAALGVVAVPARDVKPSTGVFGPRIEAVLHAECETPHGPAAWLDLGRLLEAARV